MFDDDVEVSRGRGRRLLELERVFLEEICKEMNFFGLTFSRSQPRIGRASRRSGRRFGRSAQIVNLLRSSRRQRARICLQHLLDRVTVELGEDHSVHATHATEDGGELSELCLNVRKTLGCFWGVVG